MQLVLSEDIGAPRYIEVGSNTNSTELLMGTSYYQHQSMKHSMFLVMPDLVSCWWRELAAIIGQGDSFETNSIFDESWSVSRYQVLGNC